jgi:hypothetical protein
MTAITWDGTGEKVYEAGVDHGVLYIPDTSGVYEMGYAWNGLTTVTESPSGAEASAQYADNIKYLNLVSAETFGATIEAFTYPDEFGQCDGTAEPQPGVFVGQQARKSFGLSYRTIVGNDVLGQSYGYKLHLIYGCSAAPSEKAYGTINDSPEAITFSWELTTTPVNVTGLKPTASLIIDSTKVGSGGLAALEAALYGGVGVDPRLPTPDEVIAMFAGSLTTATPTAPSFNSGTHTITIPSVTGVTYMINGVVVTGTVVITEDTIVNAVPAAGYKFPAVTDEDWFFDYV